MLLGDVTDCVWFKTKNIYSLRSWFGGLEVLGVIDSQ